MQNFQDDSTGEWIGCVALIAVLVIGFCLGFAFGRAIA